MLRKAQPNKWSSQSQAIAAPRAMRRGVCVIFNPTAGRARARRRLRRFLAKYEGRVTLCPTESPGHAVALAERAAADGCETIVAAGGDGTVHDVANGLLNAGSEATLAVVPIGSANDYAHSLRKQFGTTDLFDGQTSRVDVGRITAAEGARERYFVESAGCGLAGRVTLAARSIPFLQGLPLYGLAAWRALGEMTGHSEWELRYDEGGSARKRITMISLMLGRREGSFLLAPGARLDDQLFDFVEVGYLGRFEAMRLLPRAAFAGPPAGHPEIRLGRCARLTIASDVDFCIHTDGELFAIPGNGVREAAFEMLPGRLRVKLCEA